MSFNKNDFLVNYLIYKYIFLTSLLIFKFYKMAASNNSHAPITTPLAPPTPPSEVRFRCVQEGRKLRVRIVTPGYNLEANCQFPRDIRAPGKEFVAPASAVKFPERRGKFFYSVDKKQIKEAQVATTLTAIYESCDCVICYSEAPTIVLAPCGHFCLCDDCSVQLMVQKPGMPAPKCPMCRAAITQRVTRDQIQL